jgi:hypothetical protein
MVQVLIFGGTVTTCCSRASCHANRLWIVFYLLMFRMSLFVVILDLSCFLCGTQNTVTDVYGFTCTPIRTSCFELPSDLYITMKTGEPVNVPHDKDPYYLPDWKKAEFQRIAANQQQQLRQQQPPPSTTNITNEWEVANRLREVFEQNNPLPVSSSNQNTNFKHDLLQGGGQQGIKDHPAGPVSSSSLSSTNQNNDTKNGIRQGGDHQLIKDHPASPASLNHTATNQTNNATIK